MGLLRWIRGGSEGPPSVAVLAARGGDALRAGKPEEARLCLEEAVEIDPENPDLHAALAECFLAVSRPHEGLAHADRALRFDRLSARAWAARADSLVALDRPDEALAAFASALRIEPRGLAPRFLDKARLEARLGFYTNAFDSLMAFARLGGKLGPEKLDELGPWVMEVQEQARATAAGHALAGAQVVLEDGKRLREQGMLDEAVAAFERALQIDERLSEGWNLKANVLRRLGRLDEALSCFDRALELNPANAAAWFNQALALEAQGDPEASLVSLARFLDVVEPGGHIDAIEYARKRLGRTRGGDPS